MARACSQNEEVVLYLALSRFCAYLDSPCRSLEISSRAEDELDALGRVLLQAGFYGLNELLIFQDTGDDGSDGAGNPIEVAVLPKRISLGMNC